MRLVDATSSTAPPEDAALRHAGARRLPAAALSRGSSAPSSPRCSRPSPERCADVRAHRIGGRHVRALHRGRQHRLPDHRRRRARERAARPLAGARPERACENRAPKVLHTDDGDVWSFDDGKKLRPLGLTATAGLSYLQFRPSGCSYDTIRPGSFDTAARLDDLDADGIYAQVLYPSVTLAGARTYSDERELQCACVRAYNEWLLEFCGRRAAASSRRRSSRRPASPTRVAELEWAIEHGHRGALIATFPNGTYETDGRRRPLLGASRRKPSSRSASTSAASARAGLQPVMHAEHARLPRRRRRLEGRAPTRCRRRPRCCSRGACEQVPAPRASSSSRATSAGSRR